MCTEEVKRIARAEERTKQLHKGSRKCSYQKVIIYVPLQLYNILDVVKIEEKEERERERERELEGTHCSKLSVDAL